MSESTTNTQPSIPTLPSLLASSPTPTTQQVYTLTKPDIPANTTTRNNNDTTDTAADNDKSAPADTDTQAVYARLEKQVANKHAGYTPREDTLLHSMVAQCGGTKWTEIEQQWKNRVIQDIQYSLSSDESTATKKFDIFPRTSAALRSRWRVLKTWQSKMMPALIDVKSETPVTSNAAPAESVEPTVDNVLAAANSTQNDESATSTTTPPLPAPSTTEQQQPALPPMHMMAPPTAPIEYTSDGRPIRKRKRSGVQREKMSKTEQQVFVSIARAFVNDKGVLNAVKCAAACNAHPQLAKFAMNNYAASNAWPKYRHWLTDVDIDTVVPPVPEAAAAAKEESSTATPAEEPSTADNKVPALPNLLPTQ